MGELTFSEVEIQKLFGHEAAEDETPERLREYYFKSNTFDQVVTELPLRVLVGHKGIGKSALFQVAMLEDEENKILPVLIKPDDIIGLGNKDDDFLKIIRDWKVGLIEIITKKVFSSFGAESDDIKGKLQKYGGKALDFLKDTFSNSDKINYDPTKKMFIDHFLRTGAIHVYIDDLDRGWQGRREDVSRISALLNAVRDIVKEHRGIKFKVSLRSDVYYLARTSDESTDKIEGSVIWQSWTSHEIFVLLIKRIETFFGREVDEKKLLATYQKDLARYLLPIMEPKFTGQGHWANAPIYQVFMSLIRKRPRDLVKLFTLSARKARESGLDIINTACLESIFPEYSQGRLQDTVNEYRSELSDIERLLMNMKPNKKERMARLGYLYTTDKLLQKIDNIRQMGEFTFSNGKIASNKELAAFMYKINFLTARKETPQGIDRKYFEENRYLSNEFSDFGYDWEVHPAYRWALQPSSPTDIYNNLELTSSESK
jgi:hypothetical protein